MSLEEIKQTLEEDRVAAQQERTATEQQIIRLNEELTIAKSQIGIFEELTKTLKKVSEVQQRNKEQEMIIDELNAKSIRMNLELVETNEESKESQLKLSKELQKFEKACKERDDMINQLTAKLGELEDLIKHLKQERNKSRTNEIALNSAMQIMKNEYQTIIEEERQKMSELQHCDKDQKILIEEMNTKCIRMNKDLVKANDHVMARDKMLKELIESAEQTKRELEESNKSQLRLLQELQKLQQENAHLGRKMNKIIETTDEAIRELNNKNVLNNQKDKEIKQLKDDLAVAQKQVVIFNEELTKTLKEQKRAKNVINELQTELEKNKQVLKKSGKKSFDEMRRSLDEMKQTLEEERAATQQERTATEQQVRAYKRQVDGLNEQLTEIKEVLQKSMNTKSGLEIENCELLTQIKQLKEDLAVAQSQIVIFNEELTKVLKEQKTAKEVINQLQTELEKNKQVLKKLGKKSFDEMRRSLDEMKQTLEEERAATQQERSTTEQQVRAYKRQVHGLNEQLTEIKEKNYQLQNSLEARTGVEAENNGPLSLNESKLCSSEENEKKIMINLHEKITIVSKLEHEISNMKNGNKSLHERLTSEKIQHETAMADMNQHLEAISIELENTQKAHIIFQQKLIAEQDNHDKTKALMLNANMVLQQKLNKAMFEMDDLQQQLMSLKLSNLEHDRRGPIEQDIPPRHPGQYPSIVRSNTDLLSHSNRTQSSSRVRSNVLPPHPALGREQLAGDIKENLILQNIDREIEHVADNIRRQTLPPQTQEFLDDDNDDPSLGPYDPNLTCNGCGMRYRYGELVKLRRHLNEFCVARQYTQTIQPKHIIEYNDDNIDKEIQQVGAEVRRVSQPPRTEEFLDDDNDDPSLGPYDPNLVCNGCGMRYRYGEIQKLRRHINEFCVSLKYTQPQDNDHV